MTPDAVKRRKLSAVMRMPARPIAQLGIPLILLAFVPSAWAQSNPFAGKWSGTQATQITESCTCSGPGCAGTTHISCQFINLPWFGTVDAQGNLVVSTGAGTMSCEGTSVPVDAIGPQPWGQLSSSGTLTLEAINYSDANGSQTCPASVLQFSLSPATFTGQQSCTATATSSDSNATFSCQLQEVTTYNGTLTSAGPVTPPPFPMTVSSNITPTTANATAQVQPPAQLVGTEASLYVFAHARQSALGKRAIAPAGKDGPAPDPCVLAQLNASGQLVAADPAHLNAYATGIVNSQGQAVTILNNVPTPSVAGASFFVGYGQTSSSMLTGGVYQGAVTVQGQNSCSAAILAGAAPAAPAALSGLWWNPNESGWGVSFTQRKGTVFAAWYTYDGSGKPKWYVASACNMPSGTTGTNGTCTGPLYEVSGPPFTGTTFDASAVHVSTVGSLTVNFSDANNASMSYTANGQSRTVPIVRQVFQGGSTAPAVDYTDLWWNSSESGWGLAATQQYGVMFLAWFIYDANGKPQWFVAPSCTVVGSGCSGAIYRTSGPPLGPSFDPTAVHATVAGTASITFSDANNGTFTYTVDGVTGSRSITRQLF